MSARTTGGIIQRAPRSVRSCIGHVRADLPCRLQPGHQRHADVEDAQVGPALQRLLDRLDPIGRLRHDLDVSLSLEQQPDPRAHDPVIVGVTFRDP
jgi:hypothetical protein